MDNIFYYDNAATTRIPLAIADKMAEINQNNYYNAQGLTFAGLSAKKELESARKKLADYYGVPSSTIIFTGSGTEADNMAILGTRRRKGGNIVISSVEHSAIYKSSMELKRQGYDIRFCPVTIGGEIIESELLKLIDDNTTLVSIIHVSNESGAINDVTRLAKLCKTSYPSVLFHSDGVQAIGKIRINLVASNIDLYTFNGHKIGGSKGVGGLYVRDGLQIANLLFGGAQEKYQRPGTENIAAITSMALALDYYIEQREIIPFKTMKDDLISLLKDGLSEDMLIISPKNSVPNIVYISLKNVNGETMLHSLEKHGIIVGIGSACSALAKDNRIGKAIGLSTEFMHGVLRISFGLDSLITDIPFIADKLILEYNLLKDKKTS